jgi:hypothetical protein
VARVGSNLGAHVPSLFVTQNLTGFRTNKRLQNCGLTSFDEQTLGAFKRIDFWKQRSAENVEIKCVK